MGNNFDFIKHDLKRLHRVNKNQKIIIGIILVSAFTLGILFPSVLRNTFTRQTGQQQAAPLPKTSTLSLTGAKNRLIVGENFTVLINLDSKNQGVEAADFVMNYDPAYLKVDKVATDTFFKSYPINTYDGNSVRISGVAFFDGKKLSIPKGKGTVGIITFTTVAATPKTTVTFDRTKTIIAANGQNILNPSGVTDLTVAIQ